MTKMFKAKIKGLGSNEFVDSGVWLTEKELSEVLDRQYNEKLCNKVVHFGGRFFKPIDFNGVVEEKSLKELVKSDSPLFDGNLIESLAEAGHLDEIVESCPPGYKPLVNRLVESGKFELGSGQHQLGKGQQ